MASTRAVVGLVMAVLGQLSGALLGGVAGAQAQTALFTSERATPSEYPRGIEGPAVDGAGRLYVVNFQRQGTIGRLDPGASASTLFAVLPEGSIGNGIRFDRQGRMLVADYRRHNVLVLEPGSSEARVYFHAPQFNQPNDLAVASDGTVLASDPHFRNRSGQVWRIVRGPDGQVSGEPLASERKLGVTNGIDLSPDESTLYVGESDSCELWAYRLQASRLAEPRLVIRFARSRSCDIDGLRTDVDGRILVTRPGDGTVAMVTPGGTLVREIRLLGRNPTNLAFGGPDGRTVYVTQADGGFIERFRTDRPGREFCFNGGKC